MRENTDQNNSEYGHFLRIDHIFLEQIIFMKHESITFFDKILIFIHLLHKYYSQSPPLYCIVLNDDIKL